MLHLLTFYSFGLNRQHLKYDFLVQRTYLKNKKEIIVINHLITTTIRIRMNFDCDGFLTFA